MYIFVIPYCLGGISGPAIQGLASDRVAANEQGELQGAFAILNSLSLILGPLMFSYIFFFFTQNKSNLYFPGAPYLTAAFFMLVSTVILIRSFKRR